MPQVGLAFGFYDAVAQQLGNGDISLTGHSLGEGLAEHNVGIAYYTVIENAIGTLLMIVAIVVGGLVLIPPSIAFGASATKSSSPISTSSPQNNDFNGCVERLIDDHDYPAEIKQGKYTKTAYSYAWVTFTVPQLLTTSNISYAHDMSLNKPLFTDEAFSEYKAFLEKLGGGGVKILSRYKKAPFLVSYRLRHD